MVGIVWTSARIFGAMSSERENSQADLFLRISKNTPPGAVSGKDGKVRNIPGAALSDALKGCHLRPDESKKTKTPHHEFQYISELVPPKIPQQARGRLAVGSLAGFATGTAAHAAEDEKKKDLPPILEDPNVCRGLNTCKGRGKGDHECAGQGSCATAEAHTGRGQNAC